MPKFSILLFAAAVFVMGACGASKNQNASNDELVLYSCKGNEPFWNVKVTASGITFETLDGEPMTYPYVEAKKVGGYTVYETEKKKSTIRVAIADKDCTDSMSGVKYPYTARVTVDGKNYEGCAE